MTSNLQELREKLYKDFDSVAHDADVLDSVFPSDRSDSSAIAQLKIAEAKIAGKISKIKQGGNNEGLGGAVQQSKKPGYSDGGEYLC